jgi:hypothetical protein
MKRAYKIKRYWADDLVVGGEKAGRFTTNATTKPQKRIRTSHKAKQKVFIGILWYLLIATGLTGICELREAKTAEPIKAEAVEGGSFESADIPADYVEPDLFDRYFGDKAEEARKVAECESKMNPNATNSTDDFGIMQLNAKTWADYFGVSREQLLDKETNIRLASEIYKLAGDWYDWRFSKKCHHLN